VKRPRVQPNSGFWAQLDIWETCKYEVFEEIDKVMKEKEAYAKWKKEAEDDLEERKRGERYSSRDGSPLSALANALAARNERLGKKMSSSRG
jgi:hypothetical protein